MQCFIQENSLLARLAARKLKASRVAIVVGKTIYLHNATRNDLLANTSWLRHEIAHLRQYEEYGNVLFIVSYLWESLKNGYQNNKFERLAREAERDETIVQNITFL